MTPILIGFFREIGDNDDPPLRDLISNEPIENKAAVLRYLKTAPVTAASPYLPRDVLTNERIPGELLMHEKDGYAWRSDSIYYFDKYNLKLPDDFIAQALKQACP